MDKSEGKDWFAKTLNSVTEETAKVYKISRMKFELGTITKAKHEKLSVMARKLIQNINEGKIDAKMFEPEYSTILTLDEKRAEVEQDIINLKNNIQIGFGTKDDDSDIIKIIDTESMDTSENKENDYEKYDKKI